MFNYIYDTLETRLDGQAICTFFGTCTSEKQIDTTEPAIPAAPVSPKDPSKVYDRATCEKCKISAAVAYYNVGSFANSLNGQLENTCLDYVKTGNFPTKEENQHCKDYMGKVFDKLTDTIVDKSNVSYLCVDLFDMCKPEQL